MTDLPLPASQIIALHARRFRIEEMFRDQKDHRFGWALGDLLLKKAPRLERLLLVVAVAHFLAMLAGQAARQPRLHRTYQANTVTKKRTHNVFTLGIYFILTAPLESLETVEVLPCRTRPNIRGIAQLFTFIHLLERIGGLLMKAFNSVNELHQCFSSAAGNRATPATCPRTPSKTPAHPRATDR